MQVRSTVRSRQPLRSYTRLDQQQRDLNYDLENKIQKVIQFLKPLKLYRPRKMPDFKPQHAQLKGDLIYA